MVEVGRIIKILEKMKRLSIIFTILGAIVLMASCANNDLTPETKPSFEPTPGVDVIFSTSQENVVTRTLYDGENTDGTAMRVKWVDDDRVKIFGADCSADRSVAEYSVVAAQDTDEKGEPYYYAESLTHIGEYGVQWGDSPTSDFYAIYPSNEDTNFTKNSDNSVKVTTSISAIQNVVFDQGGGIGTPVADDANNPSMPNALMYARTANAAATDAAGNPQQVNLRFKPYSTVLKFHLDGYTDDSETVEIELADITISKIEVVAPVGTKLAGKFDMNITGNQDGASATTSNITNATNVITINPLQANGSLVTISEGDYLEFDVFTIPQDNISFGDGWSVKVYVVGYDKPFTYNVKPIAVNNTYTLQAGKIHNVRIPAILIDKEAVWNYAKWMTQIPKEVYLSELSVPGAWYCQDGDYQSTTDLTEQYAAGVRAFNIDCRISKKNCNDAPLLGYIGVENSWSDNNYPDKAYLVCAGSDTAWGTGDKQYVTEGTPVSTAVSNIIKLANNNKTEIVYIIFTISEKPLTNSSTLFGTIRPDWVLKELQTVLNTSGIKEYLYTNISKDTTIEDVLTPDANGIVRNVIVKINHSVDNFYSNVSTKDYLPTGIMGSFGSLAADTKYNTASDIITNINGMHSETTYPAYFGKMNTAKIYNGTTDSGLTYYYHHGQHTTADLDTEATPASGNPTLGNRMRAINDIMDKALEIYDASTHDAWFQIGIGGSLNGDDPKGVAKVLNPFMQGMIEDKLVNDPSPVGIVLMNFATKAPTTNDLSGGLDLVHEIVQMNNKFYLKREGGDIVTGGEGDGNGNGGGSGDGNM